MSENVPTEITDASELFDVDFTENPMSASSKKDKPADDAKKNPYAAVEDVLGLPRGSTKEGIAAAKADVQRITDEARTLSQRARIVKEKENTAKNLAMIGEDDDDEFADFSLETLANDRRILRKEYMDLLRRGKAILNRIEKDLADYVNPTPEDYANYQRQYLAIVKTLDSITSALVTLRKEEEISSQKTGGITQGSATNGAAGDSTQGTAGSGPQGQDGTIEVTPRDTNAWIEKWTAELAEEITQTIQDEYNARVEEQAKSGADETVSLPPNTP